MKSVKHFLWAFLGATCLGLVVGVVFTQVQVGAAPQSRQPAPVIISPEQLGQVEPRPMTAPQAPKPELEVKPGDSEEIKILKTEIKELRERVSKLEESTRWRIRPAAQR
jgi:hypothetical protein